MKTITTKAGVTLDVGRIKASTVPIEWKRKAILLRETSGEFFFFYALPDGRIAQNSTGTRYDDVLLPKDMVAMG